MRCARRFSTAVFVNDMQACLKVTCFIIHGKGILLSQFNKATLIGAQVMRPAIPSLPGMALCETLRLSRMDLQSRHY